MRPLPPSTFQGLARTALALALLLAAAQPLAAQVTTAFTYQGELRSAGSPANASFDMEFRLFGAASGGTQIGPLVARPAVPAVEGLFSVQLDFGPAQFAGDRQWLEVRIRPAGSGSYETLSPRTEVTAAPYALGAVVALANSVTTTSLVDGTVQAADLSPGAVGSLEINSAEVQRRVNGSCAGDSFVQTVNQDGSVACAPAPAASAWSLGGNAGTDAAANFLGTTDAQPFVVRTQNTQSLRIEPNTSPGGNVITANLVAGSGSNLLTPGVRGATISGGGVPASDSDPDLSGGAPNRISDHYGTVGGGFGNRAGDEVAPLFGAAFATVGGGRGNLSSGNASTVAGGWSNSAGDSLSSVAGGFFNNASGYASAISGGRGNTASGSDGAIGGGRDNLASGISSAIGGGAGNRAELEGGTVAGGSANLAGGNHATVAGGRDNRSEGYRSSIGGGSGNQASGDHASVGGGQANWSEGDHNTIGGGWMNHASGTQATISGGQSNIADIYASTVGGGIENRASNGGVVAGGTHNEASQELTSVGGGTFNVASGRFATIPGGLYNLASGYASFAGGDQARATRDGMYTWASRTRPNLTPFDPMDDSVSPGGVANGWTDGRHTFNAYAPGGVWFVTGITGANEASGPYLTAGANAWSIGSSRAWKADFRAIDPSAVLDQVLRLPITTWRYQSEPEGIRHMGAMAEDFSAAFGLGPDTRSINSVDGDGVALAAIQGLDRKLVDENAALRTEVAELRAEQARLAAELAELRAWLRAGGNR